MTHLLKRVAQSTKEIIAKVIHVSILAVFTIFVALVPLAALQKAMSVHWAWSIPFIPLFIVLVLLGVSDLRNRRLETRQGVFTIG